jgi:hypothetical protein
MSKNKHFKKDELLKSVEELETISESLLRKSQEEDKELDPEDIVKDEDSIKEDDTEEKSEEEEEEEEEKSEDEDEDEEEVEKSLQGFFEEEELKKGMDISDFLCAFIEANVQSLGELQNTITKSISATRDTDEVLAKSFIAIAKIQKSLSNRTDKLHSMVKSMLDGQQELLDRMESIESTPQMRKSVRNIKTMDRDFQKSLGKSDIDERQLLTKSQVSSALLSLFQEGDKTITQGDILAVDSGAPLRPELVNKVYKFYGN